jgi:peptidoglycan/LPS O-acetylase OafA/YrhL
MFLPAPPSRNLTTSLSILLDSLRLFAALSVLFSHAQDHWFPNKVHNSTQSFDGAHAAVVIFFVLSGYVIGYTSNNSNRGATKYAAARLSRLCSILYPSLIITALAQMLVSKLSPSLTQEFTRGLSLPRYLFSASFINEIWFFSSAPPINRPLWSLSFEFWYYVIFGFWFYRRRKSLTSFILPILACFIAGPKILLLMPVWIFGYLAYRFPPPNFNIGKKSAIAMISFIAATVFLLLLPPFPLPIGTPPLFYASQFLTDWVTGFFFAFALWAFPLEIEVSIDQEKIKLFRKVADLTFPIYILHHPLLILWRAIFNYRVNDMVQMWIAILTVFVACTILGLLFEHQRKTWLSFFTVFFLRTKGLLYKFIAK